MVTKSKILLHQLLKIYANSDQNSTTWVHPKTCLILIYLDCFAKRCSLTYSLHFSIKWLHIHIMYDFSPMGFIHAAFIIVAHGIRLGSGLKQGMPCSRTLVTMTIWVNSLHIAGRSSVALFFEFLFTPAMPSATTMPRYMGWRIQHLVPNFSAVCHQQSNWHI